MGEIHTERTYPARIDTARLDFVTAFDPPDHCPDCGCFDMTALLGAETHYWCERCGAGWRAEFGGFRRAGPPAVATSRQGSEESCESD